MYNYLPPNFLEKCHILMNFCSKCPGRYLKVLPSLWVTILGMVDCPRDHCTMVQLRGSGRANFENFHFNFLHTWLFSGYLKTCILYVCIYWKIYDAVYGPNRYSINPLMRIFWVGTPHNILRYLRSRRGGAPHISIEVIWSDVQTMVGALHKALEQLGWGHCTILQE